MLLFFFRMCCARFALFRALGFWISFGGAPRKDAVTPPRRDVIWIRLCFFSFGDSPDLCAAATRDLIYFETSRLGVVLGFLWSEIWVLGDGLTAMVWV